MLFGQPMAAQDLNEQLAERVRVVWYRHSYHIPHICLVAAYPLHNTQYDSTGSIRIQAIGAMLYRCIAAG